MYNTLKGINVYFEVSKSTKSILWFKEFSYSKKQLTWLDNSKECDVLNFSSIAHFKRDTVLSGRVAIYQNISNATNIITPNMENHEKNSGSHRRTNIADICTVEYVMENCVKLVMALIYVLLNQKILDIQELVPKTLLEYTEGISRQLNR